MISTFFWFSTTVGVFAAGCICILLYIRCFYDFYLYRLLRDCIWGLIFELVTVSVFYAFIMSISNFSKCIPLL